MRASHGLLLLLMTRRITSYQGQADRLSWKKLKRRVFNELIRDERQTTWPHTVNPGPCGGQPI